MAWPFARLRTYVGSSTPSVKAADLNAVQDEAVNNHIVSEPTPPVLGTNTPQSTFRDTAGNNRSLIDQHGFPGGNMDTFREEWLAPISIAANTTPPAQVPNDLLWKAFTTPRATIATQTATNAYPATSLLITPGTQNLDEAYIRTGTGIGWFPADVMSLVLDFDFKLSTAAASNVTWQLGFSDADGAPISATINAMMFAWQGSGNWKATTGAGGAPTLADTGVAPTANWTRFHLEWHGLSTPYGVAAIEGCLANTAKVRFFINGARTNTTSTTIPVAGMVLNFRGYCTGGTAVTGSLGPVRLSWNRYASIDAL